MSRKILIVEDNALLREMYRSALRPLGAELVETQRGALVPDLVRTHKPDLIILDLILPDVSGQDVIKTLRQVEGTAHIPVLAVTNAVTAGDEAALKALGFSGLILKPIDLRSVSQTVARYFPS